MWSTLHCTLVKALTGRFTPSAVVGTMGGKQVRVVGLHRGAGVGMVTGLQWWLKPPQPCPTNRPEQEPWCGKGAIAQYAGDTRHHLSIICPPAYHHLSIKRSSPNHQATPGHHQTNTRPSPGHHLTINRPSPGNHPTITRPRPNHHLVTSPRVTAIPGSWPPSPRAPCGRGPCPRGPRPSLLGPPGPSQTQIQI